MSINIGIKDDDRAAVANLLNTLLADEYVLYTKARNFHWNVVGPDFSELHAFFETQYEEINEIIDDVAERARTLGGNALGTLAEFLKTARLKERPGEYAADQSMLKQLADDQEAIVRFLRADLETCAEKYRDMGTSDFLTGLMERHEKMAWMARSFLERR